MRSETHANVPLKSEWSKHDFDMNALVGGAPLKSDKLCDDKKCCGLDSTYTRCYSDADNGNDLCHMTANQNADGSILTPAHWMETSDHPAFDTFADGQSYTLDNDTDYDNDNMMEEDFVQDSFPMENLLKSRSPCWSLNDKLIDDSFMNSDNSSVEYSSRDVLTSVDHIDFNATARESPRQQLDLVTSTDKVFSIKHEKSWPSRMNSYRTRKQIITPCVTPSVSGSNGAGRGAKIRIYNIDSFTCGSLHGQERAAISSERRQIVKSLSATPENSPRNLPFQPSSSPSSSPLLVSSVSSSSLSSSVSSLSSSSAAGASASAASASSSTFSFAFTIAPVSASATASISTVSTPNAAAAAAGAAVDDAGAASTFALSSKSLRDFNRTLPLYLHRCFQPSYSDSFHELTSTNQHSVNIKTSKSFLHSNIYSATSTSSSSSTVGTSHAFIQKSNQLKRVGKRTNSLASFSCNNGVRRLTLLSFIQKLLHDNCYECVVWISPEYQIFKITNIQELANKWGDYKNNCRKDTQSLSRALRTYYSKQPGLVRVESDKYTYQIVQDRERKSNAKA